MHVPLAADGEDRHDVGVVQPGHGLGLAAEPLHRLLIGDGAESEDLERDAAAQRRLLGLVDHAHAAPAELAEDLELAQCRRLLGGRSGRSMDELDAGQARLELRGQRGMGGQQLVPIRGLPGLEIGHVTVQDTGQLSRGIGRPNGFRLACGSGDQAGRSRRRRAGSSSAISG